MVQDASLAHNSEEQLVYELETGGESYASQDEIQIEVTVVLDGVPQDKVLHNAALIADGFADQRSRSGRVGVRSLVDPKRYDVDSEAVWEVELPDTASTMPIFTVKLFAKPLDNLLDAMASLISQPYGCFEQTSSTTYPMVMAL